MSITDIAVVTASIFAGGAACAFAISLCVSGNLRKPALEDALWAAISVGAVAVFVVAVAFAVLCIIYIVEVA